MMTAQQAPTRQDRLARARAVLGAAEARALRHGGRINRTALRPAGDRSGTLSLVPTTSGTPEYSDAPTHTGAVDPGRSRPLPEALAPLVSSGALRMGSSVAVDGAAGSSLLLALAAAAAGESAWCAIAGMGDVGLRCALDAGLDPARTVVAPALREHRDRVLSALVDGVAVLVLGPDLELTAGLWRTLTDRARIRDAIVLAAAPPGRADLRLVCESSTWTGLGSGSGRLRQRRVQVSAQGRGIVDRRTADVLLPQVRGVLAAVPLPQEPQAASVMRSDVMSAPIPLRSRRAS